MQIARECGVQGVHLKIATRFLHDCAALKYFGNFESIKDAAVDKGLPFFAVRDSVFIDPRWIIDVLKGLIRHSRDALLAFFGAHPLPALARHTWLRRVRRLAIYGTLHRELVPFLWPTAAQHDGAPLSKEFWAWAQEGDEGTLWNRPVALTAEDYERILALLGGCDIVHRVSADEYLAPALLAEAQHGKIDARALSAPSSAGSSYILTVPGLPDSFVSRLLVMLRRHYEHMDFAGDAAALYYRGLKLQLLVAPVQVPAGADGAQRPAMRLSFHSCTQRQLAQVQEYLRELFAFFAGMYSIRHGVARAGLDGESVTRGAETIQVSIIEASQVSGLRWVETCTGDHGNEIINAALAAALANQKEFTREEFAAFYVSGLTEKSRIKVVVLGKERNFKPVWSTRISAPLTESILAADRADGTAQDNVLTVADPSSAEWCQEVTSRMRVVLVVVDPDLASDSIAVQQLRTAVAGRLAVIPLIAPGFAIADYSKWWPESLPELEKHALFVDLRREAEWPEKVRRELLPQAIKFLTEWRGEAPDPGAFAAAADRLVCAECSDEGLTTPLPMGRAECEARLREWKALLQVDSSGGVVALAPPPPPPLECAHGHTVACETAVSQPPILTAVPCPMCLKLGRSPPHAFSREYCQLAFSEAALGGGRAGSVRCPLCELALRILDVLQPPIFFSYNWGVFLSAIGTWSTQDLVKLMRSAIELGTGLGTWLDVGGGMGAGQSVRAEMEQGVAQSNVVILFLSDAYCSSGNCIREFLHAVRHTKFLIPVLVPDQGPVRANGPSSGWTGPGAEDAEWWRHTSGCSDCLDPDSGELFEWASLAPFRPVDLRVESVDDAVSEIVRRVLSRFHRSRRHLH